MQRLFPFSDKINCYQLKQLYYLINMKSENKDTGPVIYWNKTAKEGRNDMVYLQPESKNT